MEGKNYKAKKNRMCSSYSKSCVCLRVCYLHFPCFPCPISTVLISQYDQFRLPSLQSLLSGNLSVKHRVNKKNMSKWRLWSHQAFVPVSKLANIPDSLFFFYGVFELALKEITWNPHVRVWFDLYLQYQHILSVWMCLKKQLTK